jgi:hypothetical protein
VPDFSASPLTDRLNELHHQVCALSYIALIEAGGSSLNDRGVIPVARLSSAASQAGMATFCRNGLPSAVFPRPCPMLKSRSTIREVKMVAVAALPDGLNGGVKRVWLVKSPFSKASALGPPDAAHGMVAGQEKCAGR